MRPLVIAQRRRLKMLTVVATMVVLVSACGNGTGDEATNATDGPVTTEAPDTTGELIDVSLRLDWVAQGYQSPFYSALGLGYYEEAGLNVEIKDGRGTTDTIKLVANKSDTFGFGQLSEVSFALAAEEVPLTAIAGVFQQMPDAVFVRADSGIEELPGLEGKDLVSSPDDSSRAFFPALAEANGFDEAAVNFLNVESDSKTSVFINGEGDGLLQFSTVRFRLDEAGVETRMFKYADYGVNLLSQGLFTHEDMISENPDIVQAFVEASMRGLDYAQENPEEAVEFVVQFRQDAGTQEQFLFELQETLPLMNTENTEGQPLGYMAPEDWQRSIDLLVNYREMPEVSPDRVFTNKFVLSE